MAHRIGMGFERLRVGDVVVRMLAGIESNSGGSRGDRTRLRTQIDRLFNAHLDLIYQDHEQKITTGGGIAPRTVL